MMTTNCSGPSFYLRVQLIGRLMLAFAAYSAAATRIRSRWNE
jgi:hypothetical protein